MISVSGDFKKAIKNGNRRYLVKATITLADETVLNIDNSNIWSEGLSFENATSAESDFQFGSAIIGSMTLILNNIYADYDGYDFKDAVVELKIGLKLNSTTTEYFRKGFYTVQSATYNGSLISLLCNDYMWKFDKDFSDVTWSANITIGELVEDICETCGVELASSTFTNSTQVIQEKISSEGLTCREVLSYLAQMCRCFVKMDAEGALKFDWYKFSESDGANLYGGIFDHYSPYQTGDSADGGNFTDWTSGDTYDGGSFESMGAIFKINGLSSENISTDDIIPTGVKVIYGKDDSGDEIYKLEGTEGYVLTIKENPFITTEETATSVASTCGDMIGKSIRKFTVSALNAPYVEAGDRCMIIDHRGHQYTSLITQIRFTVGCNEIFVCSAADPIWNNTVHYNQAAKTITDTRKNIQEEMTRYESAVQNMTSLAVNSMGYHQTVETQEDGSTITYIHDNEELDESTIIYKMTIDGFFLSQDGGASYTAGFDSEGNSVLNILSAIGIKFDWAHGGTLSLGGIGNGNGEIFIYDMNGLLCGKINNNGIALWSNTTLRQIILSPLIGLVQRDADGNEFYGMIHEKKVNPFAATALAGTARLYPYDLDRYTAYPTSWNYTMGGTRYVNATYAAHWEHVGIVWNYKAYESQSSFLTYQEYVYTLPRDFVGKDVVYDIDISVDKDKIADGKYVSVVKDKSGYTKCRATGCPQSSISVSNGDTNYLYSGSSTKNIWSGGNLDSLVNGSSSSRNYSGSQSAYTGDLTDAGTSRLELSLFTLKMYEPTLVTLPYVEDKENGTLTFKAYAYITMPILDARYYTDLYVTKTYNNKGRIYLDDDGYHIFSNEKKVITGYERKSETPNATIPINEAIVFKIKAVC